MSDEEHEALGEKQDRPVALGVFDASAIDRRGFTGTELVAAALSVLWLIGAGVFFLGVDGSAATGGEATDGASADPVRLVVTLLAVFMPVAIIWVAAVAARSARIMREESARLQAAIDGMRHTYLQHQQSGGMARGATSVERKLEEIAKAQRLTESAIATFTSSRPEGGGPRRAAARGQSGQGHAREREEQPTLELGEAPEENRPPLSMEDFLRAMHFPETPDDKEGFRALRRALADHKVASLVRAAQDVLTLLSQDGIYMDDLRPDMARPEFWRKFAAGERGRAIAPLGGIRDRSSLALAAGRMRTDPVFRDAVHHFLRRFDQVYADFEETATDQDIAAMADTRTSRAFMLLGRVTGTFD